MENQKFYIGNFKEESKLKNGWFIGHFMEDGLRKTDKFEVKYWEFPPGKADHEKKIQCCSYEITFILKGRIDGEVAGGRIELKAGDYIIIKPKITNGFPDNVFEYVEGLTVKVPSIPGDKITKKIFE